MNKQAIEGAKRKFRARGNAKVCEFMHCKVVLLRREQTEYTC